MSPVPTAIPLDPCRSIRRHFVAGAVVATLLVAGLGGWAGTTTLASAIVSSGTFVVDSHVKAVQHPTGGIVGEIRVEDGSWVQAGDILLRLDATQTRASLAILNQRLDDLTARMARLVAERDDRDGISFPSALRRRADSIDVAGLLQGEQRLFEMRRQSRAGRKAQLAERVAQYGHEIAGLEAQAAAFARGIAVIEAEIADLRGLRERGLVSAQRLNALETQAATLGGELGEARAGQASAAGRIAEARLQMLQIDADLKAEVSAELRDVLAQIGEFGERRIAAEDQLRRVDVIAPRTGIVHQLAAHTIGGVVAPGEVVMQIVPDGDGLALETRIAPSDIGQIAVGQAATLRLSAFSQRTTPEIAGVVARVAADLSTDARTGQSYYLVRVAVAPAEMERVKPLTVVPGMPAEAFIVTGARTALSYLVKPFLDQLQRAFRET